MLVILAIMITIYLSTFQTTQIVLFPVTLLLSGLVMEFYLERKREYVDSILEPTTMKQIGNYTIIALFGIFLTGYVVQKFKIPMELTGYDAILYGVLIAIGEEQFFRGFITDWLLTQLKSPMLALLVSALTFMIYHFAVYGTQADALIYVFAGGFVLSWTAYKSRRISPPMLAHIINNVAAVLGGI